MILMLVMILVLPLTMFYFRNGRDRRKLDVYMGGRPTSTDMRFAGSAGIERQAGTPQLLPRRLLRGREADEDRRCGDGAADPDDAWPGHRAGGDRMISWEYSVAFLILAPIIGGLVAGIDRRITARMQGRVFPNPPVVLRRRQALREGAGVRARVPELLHPRVPDLHHLLRSPLLRRRRPAPRDLCPDPLTRLPGGRGVLGHFALRADRGGART